MSTLKELKIKEDLLYVNKSGNIFRNNENGFLEDVEMGVVDGVLKAKIIKNIKKLDNITYVYIPAQEIILRAFDMFIDGYEVKYLDGNSSNISLDNMRMFRPKKSTSGFSKWNDPAPLSVESDFKPLSEEDFPSFVREKPVKEFNRWGYRIRKSIRKSEREIINDYLDPTKKECPECFEMVGISYSRCHVCDHHFSTIKSAKSA